MYVAARGTGQRPQSTALGGGTSVVNPMVRSVHGSVMNSGRMGISLSFAILACTCCLPVSSQDALETELTALLKQVTDVTGYAVSLGYVDSTARTNPFELSPWWRT